MEIVETLKGALQTLRVNKIRSGLTMLGIVIGVSSVILLVSIGTGIKNYVTGQLEDLGANTLFVMPGEIKVQPGGGGGGGTPGAGVAASKFTFFHLNQLRREAKTIKSIMAYTENNGTISYRGESLITQVAGVGADYQSIRNQYVSSGTFFTPSQYNTSKKVTILGKTVASDLFGKVDPVGKKITVSDQRYTVLGVLEEKGSFGGVDLDNQVFIPATTAMKQFDMEFLQTIWVQSINAQTVDETKAEVETILLKSLRDDEFSVLDTKSILSVISSVLGVLTAALAGIAAISLVVGGIGIMNIMLVSVTERTREIGLRKAVGATPHHILLQFLTESTVLAFLGGFIGIMLGFLGSLALRNFIQTSISIWSVLLAFGVSALTGIFFGVAPAVRASRLNPIEALRYE